MVPTCGDTQVYVGLPRQTVGKHYYFLVRRNTQLRVKDVKVVRSAEIKSDHHLLQMKLTRKSRAGTQNGRRQCED